MIFECRLGWLQGIIFHAALVSYNQFCWTFHYSKETTKPIDHHMPHEQVYVLGIKSTRTTLHGIMLATSMEKREQPRFDLTAKGRTHWSHCEHVLKTCWKAKYDKMDVDCCIQQWLVSSIVGVEGIGLTTAFTISPTPSNSWQTAFVEQPSCTCDTPLCNISSASPSTTYGSTCRQYWEYLQLASLAQNDSIVQVAVPIPVSIDKDRAGSLLIWWSYYQQWRLLPSTTSPNGRQ